MNGLGHSINKHDTCIQIALWRSVLIYFNSRLYNSICRYYVLCTILCTRAGQYINTRMYISCFFLLFDGMYLISMHLIQNSFTWNIFMWSYFSSPNKKKHNFNNQLQYCCKLYSKCVRKSHENTVMTNWIWLLDRFIDWFIHRSIHSRFKLIHKINQTYWLLMMVFRQLNGQIKRHKIVDFSIYHPALMHISTYLLIFFCAWKYNL